mmetsp:Transcript_36899/g.56665  ORF Transcript_36899/g.56665 Transcript_36899/m.56665 type:complete len:230 (+) Transcript_36899:103-792(+)|eukprot:CAMPEP_0118702034 /NCGR_PEP_ID=MMETSP0800-20121206/17625_1 /TAXON_ID=210618 ORGANISM="Striatella unipunctata, Strain CCMP2910" /NCGR_SAMPLE_ID=MMETSP0800 /ASSEMBLY_ACC=CAM_ASM_000638 /LENGTH=229 /DNA_ID=CAMNT_0006603107 /DNA_START=51 /DNA_END=740 /DNA_ORIENTATION=+
MSRLMYSQIVVALGMIASATAFVGHGVFTTPLYRQSPTKLMGGAQGHATSMDGKQKTIDRVNDLLQKSEMVFSIPAKGLTVKQTQLLRNSMPAGTTVSVVKNKLMNIASKDTDYEPISEISKGSNLWFFVEEDISGSIKAYKDFTEDCGKKESNPILSGVLESTVYDSEGIEAISRLPPKIEIMAQIASAIKAIPTNVATVIKAPSTKLAIAIKLAVDPEEEDEEKKEE